MFIGNTKKVKGKVHISDFCPLYVFLLLDYSSGRNNGVVLKECVGWICMFVEKFQILLGEKMRVDGIFWGE